MDIEPWTTIEGREDCIERPCEFVDAYYDHFRLLSNSDVPHPEGYGKLNDEPDSYERRYSNHDDLATRDFEETHGRLEKNIGDLK